MDPLDASKYFADPRVAAFVDAVQRGNVAQVKSGLEAGISANVEGHEGFRPIHFVFLARETTVLGLLLAAGADPNAALSTGNTPLHFSVRHQNADFTRVLLTAGADANGRGEHGKPHLHEAIDQENPAHVSLLASAGADVNAVWAGKTPVLSALQIGEWEVARILIDAGADLRFKDRQGLTPLDFACRFISRIPVTEENTKGVSTIVAALGRRRVSLPCAEDVARFLK